MAAHSSVLAWRIPGTGEPGGLPSMGSHRVGHDWSDLVVAAAAAAVDILELYIKRRIGIHRQGQDFASKLKSLPCDLPTRAFQSLHSASLSATDTSRALGAAGSYSQSSGVGHTETWTYCRTFSYSGFHPKTAFKSLSKLVRVMHQMKTMLSLKSTVPLILIIRGIVVTTYASP